MSANRRVSLLAVAAVVAAGCGSGDAADVPATGSGGTVPASETVEPDDRPAAATGEPTTEWPVVPAPSLADNLLGDPAELAVSVWLPASYATTSQRYPVVYFLAGYREAASTVEIGDALAQLVADGAAPEMILVGVSGLNSLGGSFYVDSPVTGNWSAAVHTDLVDAIDARYRTIADRESRGIAGFSMGGFGSVDLAMRHPEVFGAVYALAPGLLAPGDLASTEMFADTDTVAAFLDVQQALAAGDRPRGMSSSVEFSLAYGSAFAAAQEQGPPWVAYPYSAPGGDPDPAVWARWEAGYGGIDAEVESFADEFSSLAGIALDYGVHDEYEWIPRGTEHLAAALRARGIDVQLTSFEGGHGSVGPRAREVMLPFFARTLALEPS